MISMKRDLYKQKLMQADHKGHRVSKTQLALFSASVCEERIVVLSDINILVVTEINLLKFMLHLTGL